jgi:hypothetical protein
MNDWAELKRYLLIAATVISLSAFSCATLELLAPHIYEDIIADA